MVELDESSGKQYMLVNEIEYKPNVNLNWREEEKKHQTLLLPILSVIFMNGGAITEGKLHFDHKLSIL